MNNKKRNNKGFSLVELIVVVAIMAVLVGVLAPAYLTYVEKTRLQKDNSAIAEIAQAMKIAAADEDVNSTIVEAGLSITIGKAEKSAKSVTYVAGTKLDDAVKVVVPSFTTTSNTYKNSGTPIVLTLKITNGAPVVEGAGIITTPNAEKADAEQPTF